MRLKHLAEATERDCEEVAEFAARTFTEAFSDLYRPENMAQHLLKTYSAEYFRDSLKAGDSVLMLREGSQLIGYGKVGQVRLPYKAAPRGSQEIQRLYVDKGFQRRGHGKAMMFEIMQMPRVATARGTYLSVHENNLMAQGLYAQYGFKPVGKYQYRMGDQLEPVIIMERVH